MNGGDECGGGIVIRGRRDWVLNEEDEYEGGRVIRAHEELEEGVGVGRNNKLYYNYT